MRAFILAVVATVLFFASIAGFLALPGQIQTSLILGAAGIFLVAGVFLGFYTLISHHLSS